MGVTNSITPFLQLLSQNKNNWQFLLIQKTLLPHLPLILLTSIGTLVYFLHTSLAKNIDVTLGIIMMALIILESGQSFMRQLLYALFQTTAVVSIELGLLIARYGAIWGLSLLCNYPMTISLIMWSHLASTLICLSLFLALLTRVYKKLPETELNIPAHFSWRLAQNRAYNYLLRLSRNIFSIHFLTPLFAFQFGLKTAGLFFFASKLARIVSAVVKLSIGYSGNGLLAQIKNKALPEKRAAFSLLAAKLLSLIIPACALFAPLCAGALHRGYIQSAATDIFVLCLLYLIITFFEFFFMLYEQWYILEEAAHRLCIIKLIELGALFALLKYCPLSAIQLLAILIIVRALHFGFIAFHAYKTWGIALTGQINLRSSSWYAALGCLCWYFFL